GAENRYASGNDARPVEHRKDASLVAGYLEYGNGLHANSASTASATTTRQIARAVFARSYASAGAPAERVGNDRYGYNRLIADLAFFALDNIHALAVLEALRYLGDGCITGEIYVLQRQLLLRFSVRRLAPARAD